MILELGVPHHLQLRVRAVLAQPVPIDVLQVSFEVHLGPRGHLAVHVRCKRLRLLPNFGPPKCVLHLVHLLCFLLQAGDHLDALGFPGGLQLD